MVARKFSGNRAINSCLDSVIAAADFLQDWDWQLRNHIKVRFPVFKSRLKQPPVFTNQSQAIRLEELKDKYDLSKWPKVCNSDEWQQNLYLLDLLDQLLGQQKQPGPSLDIGCKNGVYFPAQASFIGNGWDGIELDAYRRYWSLASRRDHGEYMAKHFNCHYITGSLLDLQPEAKYQLITWILPFVAEMPLSAWGLPRRFYQPAALLAHAFQLLAPGGKLLIINQGEWETEVQKHLFIATSIKAEFLGQVSSLFSPYNQPRFAWLINKTK